MAGLPRLDLGRVILALTLAAALWWVITTEQNPERNELFPSSIPVDVINAPPSLVVVGEVPQIQAQVRAASDIWSRLRATSFRAVADGARAGPGANELPVTLEPLDTGVRSAEPVPPRIRVTMEESRERLIPVRVNLTGSVPFGYSSGPARVSPDRVTAVGPASAIDKVQEAVVDIPLDQLTLSLNNTYGVVPVTATRERVDGVRLTPAVVTVDVAIDRQVSYKEVGIRPIVRGKLASGYYLEPIEVNPPTTTIVGDPVRLGSVSVVETQPVDVSGLAATAVKQVPLQAPVGATFLQPRPVSLTLRVTPIPTTQTLTIMPTVSGLGAGLQLVDPILPVEVTITGPAPTLQNLSGRDFRVILDLEGRPPGQHVVPLQPQIPAGFRLDQTNPPAITVTIRELPAPEPLPTAPTGA
jgi:YbbR domain-containing protein